MYWLIMQELLKTNLLMRISEDDFDKVIQVNLKSVF